MTFNEQNNFYKKLQEIIQKEISKNNFGLTLWKVTDIQSKQSSGYITDYKCNIQKLNFKYALDNVPFIGLGLGHKKGILKYPNVDDFVVVAYFGDQPMILGTIFDYFSQSPDSIPKIQQDELIIVPKEDGSILLFKNNNDIIIRIADSTGNIENGSKIKLSNDGSFKLYNKDNYGIDVDVNGLMKLRGTTIIKTQTPGTW